MATTKKTGRPPKPINATLVAKLAGIGCTNVEIADIVGCDESTVRDRFPDLLLKARAKMKEKLRRTQYRVAVTEGNVTMMIWLGKQMLGQTDQNYLKVDLDRLSDEELEAIAAGRLPKA